METFFALCRSYPRHLYSCSLPSYLFRCDILQVQSLSDVRRYLMYVSVVYDILSGKINGPNIVCELAFILPYRRLGNQNYLFNIPFIRISLIFRIDF